MIWIREANRTSRAAASCSQNSGPWEYTFSADTVEDPSGPYGQEIQGQEHSARRKHRAGQFPGNPVVHGFQHIQIPDPAQDHAQAEIQCVDHLVDDHRSGKHLPFNQHPDDIQRQGKHDPVDQRAEQHTVQLLAHAYPDLVADYGKDQETERIQLNMDNH